MAATVRRSIFNYAGYLSKIVLQRQNISSHYIGINTGKQFTKLLSSIPPTSSSWDFIDLDQNSYEKVCSETLEGLSYYCEELIEGNDHLRSADVSYGDGVLTVKFGKPYGTYVINRQSPNKQIWLSSPKSGPKRYDFFGMSNAMNGKWVYKHDNESLHDVLQREIKTIINDELIDFYKLPYAK